MNTELLPARQAIPVPALPDPRQREFCILVVLLGNASEAYRRAGYEGRANVQACKLLSRPRIKREVERLRQAVERGEALLPPIDLPRTPPEPLNVERKREILAAIAEDPTEPTRNRIAAIQEDNRLMGTYLDKREAVDFRQGHEHGYAVYEAAADLIPPEKWDTYTDRVRNLGRGYDQLYHERLERRSPGWRSRP